MKVTQTDMATARAGRLATKVVVSIWRFGPKTPISVALAESGKQGASGGRGGIRRYHGVRVDLVVAREGPVGLGGASHAQPHG